MPPTVAAHGLRVLRASVLAMSLGIGTGCYSSRAVLAAPGPGRLAAVTLNDRGRVALGDAVGPNADRVEGDVVSRGDSSFVLAVRYVRYVGGAANEWRGEHVTVPIAGVRGIEERHFSKARTWLVVGAATGAFIAFIVTRSLVGGNPTIIDQGGGGPKQGS